MKLSKGVILLFLGLLFKVTVAENSTQVYWLELEIESSVYKNFTDLLNMLTQIDIEKASVTNINITTDCTWNVTHKNCSCELGYTCSEDMCKNYDCCNDTCTQKVDGIAVCLPKSRVSINGFTAFENETCKVLCDPTKESSAEYKNLKEKITKMLAENYSRLKFFDSLTINSYRSGSLIVDYTVKLMSSITLNELEKVIMPQSDLKTTGLITIEGPQKKVIEIGSSESISCTPPKELETIAVKWFLRDGQNKTTEITTGKEATLRKVDTVDVIELRSISGSWRGTIQCVYSRGSIKHTASTELDIALLPEIQAMSTPQFPDCTEQNAELVVDIQCKILKDVENYNVTWNTTLTYKNNAPDSLQYQGKFIIYKIKATIYCASSQETVDVTCIFTNDRSQSRTARSEKVQIPIIYRGSTVCEKDGVWPVAKSNFTAHLPCEDNAVGLTRRNCNDKGWGNIISSCVNTELHDIQQAVEELNKGIGYIKDDAGKLFENMQQSTTMETFKKFANINASMVIFKIMNNVSKQQSNKWNDTIMPAFVSSISNALNETDPWKNPADGTTNLSVTYLQTIEQMISNSNLTMHDPQSSNNVKLAVCNETGGAACGDFNASVKADAMVAVVAYRNLHKILPQYDKRPLENTIVSVTTVNNNTNQNQKSISVALTFNYGKRLRNHEMYCVYWDENNETWSSDGCTWGGAENEYLCTCTHNSAFTIMMSKNAETLPYMKELTYAGLGISIVSLVLCLIIEFLVWDTVVKSDISNFRHVALVNICLCLLFAHCGFLASSEPEKLPQHWCSILTVAKHFFFLAVFFWMLCLSVVLLHQMIFVFDQLRKKVFLVLSITVGYVCPLICVATTYITFENGKEGEYYSKETCWLLYHGVLKGSLFSFIIPALTIVMVNLFTLVVVIMKIVTPTVSNSKARDQKDVARGIIKTIVFLSPVLGITWLLGILVLHLDLTQKPFAQIVGYSFTLFNSLQGFLILLTNCFGEKKVRDAFLKRFQSKKSAHSKSESSAKATSSSVITK